MATWGDVSIRKLEPTRVAKAKPRRANLLRQPHGAFSLVLALTTALVLSVTLVPATASAAARPAAARSLAAAPPTATTARWAKPGLATVAGEPVIGSRSIHVDLYCNGETSCRGWFTLVAGGLRLVVYRWVGDRRVITHVIHHLLLGAANFEIAPGGTDGITLTLSARNRRVLLEAGGLPTTLAGKDVTSAWFDVNLPARTCTPAPRPVEH